jgi:hypothetical protein
MPEVPNAWKCDYCHTIMVPIERKTERWHTKWCSACGAKLWEVFIGDQSATIKRGSCCLRKEKI